MSYVIATFGLAAMIVVWALAIWLVFAAIWVIQNKLL